MRWPSRSIEPAYIPFGNDVWYHFVSRRVGNTLVHPVTGPLIAQMWVL